MSMKGRTVKLITAMYICENAHYLEKSFVNFCSAKMQARLQKGDYLIM